jgi:hypothetical protein
MKAKALDHKEPKPGLKAAKAKGVVLGNPNIGRSPGCLVKPTPKRANADDFAHISCSG